MLIFHGLPGKDRAGSPKRMRNPLPNPTSRAGEKSGNLGRQPETRKGIKLGGCLRKQGVGRLNRHTSSWFVGHERCAKIGRPPTPLGVSGRNF